jgi:hypothetical protein
MLKFVRWNEDDAITHNLLRMRDDVMALADVITLEEVISRQR